MVATRITSAFAAMVLLSSPAVAQQSVFVEGFRQLDRAMMAGDHSGINAAIDKMASGLGGWHEPALPTGHTLLDDEAADIPVVPLAAYADAFRLIQRGEYGEAIVSLRRAAAIAIDERSPLAASGLLAQQGRDIEAERALRSIVAAFPDSAVAHWWLARIYERLNRISDARREYQTVVLAALTGRATLYAAIGRLSRAEGDFARATEALEQRLRLTPTDPVAHKELARIYLEQGRVEQALASFRTAVSLDSRDAEALAAIGRILLDTGLPSDAIPALRRALELMPPLFEARYALGMALKQTGQGDEAVRQLELFERARRDATEDRRRTMIEAVREETAKQEAAKQAPR